MHITEEMLNIALRKSVEAGLLPRRASPAEVARNQEVLQEILKAVLDTMSPGGPQASA